MSEELKRGIPKAIPTGEVVQRTEEEKRITSQNKRSATAESSVARFGDERMNKAEANEKAKKVFEEWVKEKDEIEKKAKEDGIWMSGLDANNHLFKELNKKAKEELEKIKSMIDE